MQRTIAPIAAPPIQFGSLRASRKVRAQCPSPSLRRTSFARIARSLSRSPSLSNCFMPSAATACRRAARNVGRTGGPSATRRRSARARARLRHRRPTATADSADLRRRPGLPTGAMGARPAQRCLPPFAPPAALPLRCRSSLATAGPSIAATASTLAGESEPETSTHRTESSVERRRPLANEKKPGALSLRVALRSTGV